MKKTSKRGPRMFVPLAEQWSPESVTSPQVQYWTESGSMMGLIPLARARELIAARAAYSGGPHYVCEAGARTDRCNAS